MQLATAATTNANWPTDAGVTWRGGTGTLFVAGTWDSATAKLQAKAPSGSVWIDVGTDVEFSANGMANFQLGPCALRLNVAGGGESSQAITAEIS